MSVSLKTMMDLSLNTTQLINGTFDLYQPCDMALSKNGILKTKNICNEVSWISKVRIFWEGHKILSKVHTDKSKVEISQNFVAFSECMNFMTQD